MIYVIIPVTFIGSICMFIIDKKAKKEVHDKGVPTIATIVRKDGPHLTYDVEYHGMCYSNTINVKRRVMINTQIGDKFPALILKEKIHKSNKGLFSPSYIDIILIPYPKDYPGRDTELARIDSIYYNKKGLFNKRTKK